MSSGIPDSYELCADVTAAHEAFAQQLNAAIAVTVALAGLAAAVAELQAIYAELVPALDALEGAAMGAA